MKEVTECLAACGLYEMFVRIEAKTLGHLDKVAGGIRQMPEIQQTNTLVGVQ